jgi:hypothetical protein
MLVILATQEAEMGRMVIIVQSGRKPMKLFSNNKKLGALVPACNPSYWDKHE